LAREATRLPKPPTLTPHKSAFQFPVNSETVRAAGTLLISWLRSELVKNTSTGPSRRSLKVWERLSVKAKKARKEQEDEEERNYSHAPSPYRMRM
jgi:hypothetical protein